MDKLGEFCQHQSHSGALSFQSQTLPSTTEGEKKNQVTRCYHRKQIMYVTYLESTLSGMTSSPILCLSLCFFLCFLLDLERDVSFLSLSSSAETSTLNSPNENMFNSGVDRYYFNKVTVTFNIYRFLALTTSSPLHQLPKVYFACPTKSDFNAAYLISWNKLDHQLFSLLYFNLFIQIPGLSPFAQAVCLTHTLLHSSSIDMNSFELFLLLIRFPCFGDTSSSLFSVQLLTLTVTPYQV